MKKLLSLKKFQKENQDTLLEKEILAEVNGGMGGLVQWKLRVEVL